MFIISQLWLTSHPRSTVVPLDTGTPGRCRDFYSVKFRMLNFKIVYLAQFSTDFNNLDSKT